MTRLGTPATPNKSSSFNFEDLQSLQNEFEKLKHIVDDKLGRFGQLIDKKVSKEDLDNLERRMLDQLNGLINNLIERFADKKETAKKFAQIEKQVSQFLIKGTA